MSNRSFEADSDPLFDAMDIMSPMGEPWRDYLPLANDGYVILGREIASGSFGRISAGVMVDNGGNRKEVAIKALHIAPGYLHKDETRGGYILRPQDEIGFILYTSFVNECHLLVALQEEAQQNGQELNTPEVFALVRPLIPDDEGSEKYSPLYDPRCFIVMEMIDGKPLDKVIAEGNITMKQTISFTRQLLEELVLLENPPADSQRGQIVYVDLKPHNILLEKDGRLRFVDLGMAYQLHENVAYSIDGSFAYMSPERFDLNHFFAFTDDIFAAGIMAFEMATGIQFTALLADNRMHSVVESSFGTPLALDHYHNLMKKKLDQLVDDGYIPQAFADFILQATNPDLRLRFQNAAEMREAFDMVTAVTA